MKITSVACALAALFALTAQAPAAPPVAITWCAFNIWTMAPIGAGGQILVHFTNTGGATVDDVRFRMLWGDHTFTLVDDAGNFPTGNEIRHTLSFDHYGEITGETLYSLNLAVDHAHLTSGVTWDAPLAGAPAVRCIIYRT